MLVRGLMLNGFLIVILVFVACMQSPATEPVVDAGDEGVVQDMEPVEGAGGEAAPQSDEQAETGGGEPASDALFTIQAPDDLRPALTTLYGAAHDGKLPAFSEQGDLMAVESPDLFSEYDFDRVFYYLPDTGLVLSSDSQDALEFAEFAISPDSQQVLIDEGLLPAVVTVTDQAGNTVEIPQPVRRVINAYGPSVYYLYTVGAESRIVSANYLGAKTIDSSGGQTMARIDQRYPEIVSDTVTANEASVEDIAALEPDIVFTSPESPWIDAVGEVGIPIFLYDAETPEEIKQAVLTTGEIFGPQALARARAWAAYYDSIFEAVVSQTEGIAPEHRVKVLFTGTEPLRVASGDMYQTILIDAGGGVSVSSELFGYWNDVNLEQVVVWNPDVILVPPYGGASVEAITESPEWQVLEAVQEGRVYRVPQLVAPWDTPTPDSVLAVVWMAQLLYPDIVDLSCDAEAEYFYQTFYGYDLSPEETARMCELP
ncbi:MAG: ABC transporter substrate-binding protein [Anaerolineae bacterium]|nr:ABC transporter substrate-binding protein [Anaerolineae bacterium]